MSYAQFKEALELAPKWQVPQRILARFSLSWLRNSWSSKKCLP